MFAYDPAIIAAAQVIPKSVPDVLRTLQAIQDICEDGDGLKWFNGLYMQVTQAVETRVTAGGFSDPTWLKELDVQFARLYFEALQASLLGTPAPGCWRALFSVRADTRIARIQFALAGINAHINHDLCEAVVTTCQITGRQPQHGNTEYDDYTATNATLDPLIDEAKNTLNVRLLGDPLPLVSQLQNTIAAWGLAAAREQAWNNAEILWHLQGHPVFPSMFLDSLNGLTTVGNKTLLVPVP